MRIYWDSCVVIYRIQKVAPWDSVIAAMLEPILDVAALHVSHLTRLECRVYPIRKIDLALLKRFDDFFARPDVRTVGIRPAVFDLATELRAVYNVKTPDALHLASAIAAGCDEFWTNDRRLVQAAAGRIKIVSVDDA
jgi:uncharacterized protein